MNAPAPRPAPLSAKVEAQIRVMVVDDSAAFRGFSTRKIESDPQLKVVGIAHNGKAAVAHEGLASGIFPLSAVGAEIRKYLGMGK
jgi:chemotaxis response regulator CheB